MTINAINGSVINKTAFPGAEAGVSLIELVGTVQVTASIQSVKLRLHATAVATPRATSTVQTTRRTQLAATTAPGATASALAYTRIFASVAERATCSATAGVGLKYLPAASTQCFSVVAAVYGYTAAKNTASISCVASALSAVALTQTPRSATTATSAVASAQNLMKKPSEALGLAAVTSHSSITFRNGLGATATAASVGTVSTIRKIRQGATTSSVAVAVAGILKKLLMPAVKETAAALCYAITIQRGVLLFALTQANAYTSARIRAKYSLTASVMARAIAQSAASDYASAMPAPAERTMTVGASERRMEVTE